MEVVLFNTQQRTFTLRGRCPHGPHDSAFLLVTNVHADRSNNWIGALQCQGCAKYILAILRLQVHQGHLQYVEHYPLGKPDDTVAPEIPEHIQPDFKEALRCLFVDAYNATAEMCRRALEASCLNLGAPKKKVLEDMIDALADKRIITPHLQQAAHKIRLGGNRGAHPPQDAPPAGLGIPTQEPEEAPITKIEKDHALAIVEFTRHFFEHVYIIPKQLDKYDFSKPKAAKP
jgi:hypothetical protein